jgi:hypothetical protein
LIGVRVSLPRRKSREREKKINSLRIELFSPSLSLFFRLLGEGWKIKRWQSEKRKDASIKKKKTFFFYFLITKKGKKMMCMKFTAQKRENGFRVFNFIFKFQKREFKNCYFMKFMK